MSDNYDRILGGLGVTTTTTPATVAHACALAGGITASVTNANANGCTLSLCDTVRVWSWTLTPEQAAAYAACMPFVGAQPYLEQMEDDIASFVGAVRDHIGMDLAYHEEGEEALADLVAGALPAMALGEGDR